MEQMGAFRFIYLSLSSEEKTSPEVGGWGLNLIQARGGLRGRRVRFMREGGQIAEK